MSEGCNIEGLAVTHLVRCSTAISMTSLQVLLYQENPQRPLKIDQTGPGMVTYDDLAFLDHLHRRESGSGNACYDKHLQTSWATKMLFEKFKFVCGNLMYKIAMQIAKYGSFMLPIRYYLEVCENSSYPFFFNCCVGVGFST